MKWYKKVLNTIFKGALLFLMPLMLLVFAVEKAIKIVQALIINIKPVLPDQHIFGIGIFTLLSILLILLSCYFMGLLAEKKKIKLFIDFLENNVLTMIPGYALMKSRAGEAIGQTNDSWKPVLAGDPGDWKIGIEIEQQANGYCAVFFPEPPDAKAGEIKLMHASKLKRLNVPVSKITNIIKNYGNGITELAENNDSQK